MNLQLMITKNQIINYNIQSQNNCMGIIKKEIIKDKFKKDYKINQYKFQT